MNVLQFQHTIMIAKTSYLIHIAPHRVINVTGIPILVVTHLCARPSYEKAAREPYHSLNK